MPRKTDDPSVEDSGPVSLHSWEEPLILQFSASRASPEQHQQLTTHKPWLSHKQFLCNEI